MERERLLDIVWPDGGDDRMSCIVPSRAPCTHVGLSSKHVDEFSFPLVAPLGAEDNGHCETLSG